MQTKILEIRDRGTFIAALAIGLIAENDVDRYYLYERCGYAIEPVTVMLTNLNGGDRANNDCYDWNDRRTWKVAHNYIAENWHKLNNGDVVDVEYILGETTTIKTSERFGRY